MPQPLKRQRVAHVCKLDLSAGVPTDIPLFPVPGSSTEDGRGPFHYDPAVILAAFAAVGGPVALDYEHQLDDGGAQQRTGAVPASGWITEMYFDPATGIRAKVEWTAAASRHLAEKEYRYFSPAFYVIPDDAADPNGGAELIEIFGGSLVNRPAFGAQMQIASRGDYTNKNDYQSTTGETTPMTKEQLEALGLAEGADEAAITAAIAALNDRAKSQAALLDALFEEVELALAADETATAEVVTAAAKRKYGTDLTAYVAKADHDKVTAELATLKQTAAETEVKAQIAAIEATGVTLSDAQRAAYVKVGLASRDDLAAVLSALKPAIKIGDAQNPDAVPNKDVHGLTAAEQASARKAGVTLAAYAKSKEKIAASNGAGRKYNN